MMLKAGCYSKLLFLNSNICWKRVMGNKYKKKRKNLIAIDQCSEARDAPWIIEFIFHFVNSHLIIFLFDGREKRHMAEYSPKCERSLMDALMGCTQSRRAPVESQFNSASHIRVEGSSHEPIWREDPSSFLDTSISTIQSAFDLLGARKNERKCYVRPPLQLRGTDQQDG